MTVAETVERVGNALQEVFSQLDDCFQSCRDYLDERPDYPGAWTILEHLEHVALANHFLLLTIRKGCRIAMRRAAGAVQGEEGSELDALEVIATPGAFLWEPPLHMVPTGERSPAEVRAELGREREECLELLRSIGRGQGRLYSISMSVNRLGRLDMYQWLYFLAQHARFHVNFIAGRKKKREAQE